MAFTKQVNLSTSEELELPIPDSRLGQLQRDWDATYGLTLDAHLELADSLRGRIWHEFSKRTLSVIEVNRVKSLLAQSSPSVSETVKLQDTSRGALSLSSARDPETPVRDVVSYYFGLRILINARSFCGNFVAKGPDGREARFFSLSEGRDYADSCLRDATQYGQGSVTWLHHNDMLTRGKMASKIRHGALAGQALKEVEWRQWRAPNPEVDSVTPPPPPKGTRLQTVTMLKGGLKICKAFHDHRGCRDRKCHLVPVCDVKGCGSKDHNRLN